MVLTILPQVDYTRLQELCIPFDTILAVTAILTRESPAQIYVDNLNNPSIALLFHWDGHRIYLAGEPHNEQLVQAIRQTLFSFFSSSPNKANRHEFVMYYASPLWESCFQSLCMGMETSSAKRAYYLLSHVLPNWQAHLLSTWRLRKIDELLLTEQKLQYLPQLIEEIYSESSSREDFFKRKFGYCLQENTTLIGWCLSEYNHADRCEVGIETMAEYRKRGVALLTASALIAHALANGITRIGWHCWSNNAASRALAIKLGGVLTREYFVLVCRFSG